MIVAGYMGAVSVVTTVKWFWFLFGMAMFLPVVYSLARTFRETVITRKVCTALCASAHIHQVAGHVHIPGTAWFRPCQNVKILTAIGKSHENARRSLLATVHSPALGAGILSDALCIKDSLT
jgi:hypothetical protein